MRTLQVQTATDVRSGNEPRVADAALQDALAKVTALAKGIARVLSECNVGVKEVRAACTRGAAPGVTAPRRTTWHSSAPKS